MDWKQLFPFKPHSIPLPSTLAHGTENAYLTYYCNAAGDAWLAQRANSATEAAAVTPILCLHGNPTWSFYFRNLFALPQPVFSIDHLGCGFSSKPQDYPYNLQQHIDNAVYLLASLKIERYHLVAHDWGGAIAMGVLAQAPNKVKSITLMNTAAFYSTDIPKRIALLKTPWLGEFCIRRFNIFARAALTMATTKGLGPAEKQGYLAPYGSYAERVGIAAFVADIPFSRQHKTALLLAKIEAALAAVRSAETPTLLLWGMRDFCFHEAFLTRFQSLIPHAQSIRFENAGHYLLEDAKEEVMLPLVQFYKNIPGV